MHHEAQAEAERRWGATAYADKLTDSKDGEVFEVGVADGGTGSGNDLFPMGEGRSWEEAFACAEGRAEG